MELYYTEVNRQIIRIIHTSSQAKCMCTAFLKVFNELQDTTS